jgi:hypothetical protein
MKNAFFIAALFWLVLFSASCVKNEVGPQGLQGPKGDPGLANINTIVFRELELFENPLLPGVYQAFADTSAITSAVVNQGFLQVYVAEHKSDGSLWTALPGHFSPDPGAVPFVQLGYQVSPGRVAIFTSESPAFSKIDVRLVIGTK